MDKRTRVCMCAKIFVKYLWPYVGPLGHTLSAARGAKRNLQMGWGRGMNEKISILIIFFYIFLRRLCAVKGKDRILLGLRREILTLMMLREAEAVVWWCCRHT